MFKKHAVQMKLVKDATPAESDSATDFVTAVYSTEIVVNRLMKTAVKSAITVIAAKATSEIALHIAKTLIK